jgi:hypothetical protein
MVIAEHKSQKHANRIIVSLIRIKRLFAPQFDPDDIMAKKTPMRSI